MGEHCQQPQRVPAVARRRGERDSYPTRGVGGSAYAADGVRHHTAPASFFPDNLNTVVADIVPFDGAGAAGGVLEDGVCLGSARNGSEKPYGVGLLHGCVEPVRLLRVQCSHCVR